MPYEFITVEKRGHLTIVTMNRPEAMNSLHPPACAEMNEAFNDFAADPEAWVGILAAAGAKAFSAGNDLKWQAQHGPLAVRQGLDSLNGGFGGLTRRFDCFKPLIAAVNGLALGAGFEMALACDIIVAAENASFGLPEPTVGLMAVQGGVHRLPRHLPYHLAMGLMFTGRRLSAPEAARLGLVNEVVPAAELMDKALAWAEAILACAPLAVRASKEAVLQGLAMPLKEAIPEVFPATEVMRASQDILEGPKAFAEKRKPVWSGR
ncbi:MAG: enoyl-CoA hydratase-related protein [Pseudomonadota bacterium]